MTVYEADEIPQPPGHYFLGNVSDLVPDLIGGFRKMHTEYGPVVKVSLPGRSVVSIADPDALQTVSKDSGDSPFTKEPIATYSDLAILNGRGLVTTATKDPDWQIAHKLLMPAFSARAMRAYQDQMGKSILDLLKIVQNIQERGEVFDVSRWMVALALESIGSIGFGYEFGLLEDPDKERHPFTVALQYVQAMIMKRGMSPNGLKWLQTSANLRFNRDLQTLRSTVENVLRQRKESPRKQDDKKDLLDFMLAAETKDGEKLDDQLIRDEIITFLSAGHNTTSSFLSWTLYELGNNPDIEAKIRQEIVDAGIKPGEIPTVEQVGQCKYLDRVIKESLRVHSPISTVIKYCLKDTTIKAGTTGDEYKIPAGQMCHVQIASLHFNPKVWPNPELFDPDRFLPENEVNRHPNAWMTFSDGPRACIGRQFSLQEGKLALIMLLSKFSFRLADPNQEVGYQIIVSVKPIDLMMKVSAVELPQPTNPKKAKELQENSAQYGVEHGEKQITRRPSMQPGAAKFPLPKITLLYGTQTGTSQEYAHKLAGQARGFGFKEVKVVELDDWELMQKSSLGGGNDGAVRQPEGNDGTRLSEVAVFITATYNGNPPDNALKFEEWLDSQIKTESAKVNLSGLLYAVFGCGNRQWSATFQQFPRKTDSALQGLGAERLLAAGAGDANEDIDGDFSEWSAAFWSHLMQRYGQDASGGNADIMSNAGPMADPTQDFKLSFLSRGESKEQLQHAKENVNKHNFKKVRITENRELQNTAESKRSTRHIVVNFADTEDGDIPLYNAGDHLEVRPVNDSKIVENVALGLGFALDSVFEVTDLQINNLSPRSVAANIKGPCTIRNALTYYADLTGPPTRYTLSILGKQLAKWQPELAQRLQEALQSGKDTPRLKEFLASHRTILDIIKAMKVKELSWKEFIAAVNVMVPRKYSISSGPLESPHSVSVTVGIVEDIGGPDNHTIYNGLSSGYLKAQSEGSEVYAGIAPCKGSFHLPEDPTIPVIFICAGTGLAPFRGFLQERHAKGLKGTNMGGNSDAYLFFGCRNPDHDFIYREELESYVADGTLTNLYTAFSRVNSPVKYVQHLLYQQAELLYHLLIERNAHVYICGSAGDMARDVKRTFERLGEQIIGLSEDESKEKLQGWINEEIEQVVVDYAQKAGWRSATVIWRDDRDDEIIPREQRHEDKYQRKRRRLLGKLRTFLMLSALDREDAVVWLDADIYEIEERLIQRMVASGKDIVTASCRQGDDMDHDLNAWRGPRIHPNEEEMEILRQDGDYIPRPTKDTQQMRHLRNQGEFVPLDSKQPGADKEEDKVRQAIVLGDSFDERFMPITADIPRCLMPVCNVPVIEYTLELLAVADIKEVSVICKSQADAVREYISKSRWNRRNAPFSIEVVEASEARSVGDAIREADGRQIISGDFILLNADTVSNIDLRPILEEHRNRKSSDRNTIMTMIFKEASATHPARSKSDSSVFFLDAQSNQCLHYEQLQYFPKTTKIDINPEIFTKHPEVQFRNDLIDTYIDICTVEVLALFQENFDYQHIRRDFVHGILTSDIFNKTIYAHITHDGYADRVRNGQLYDSISRDILSRWTFPLVPETMSIDDDRYEYLRGSVYKGQDVVLARSTYTGPQTQLGNGTAIGDNTIVTNSVIGRRCFIGKNVVIEGAYIWDDVVINDGCRISHSLLANGQPATSVFSTDSEQDMEMTDEERKERLGEASNGYLWKLVNDEDDEDYDPRNDFISNLAFKSVDLPEYSEDEESSSASEVGSELSESEDELDIDAAIDDIGETFAGTNLASIANEDFRREVTASIERALAENHLVDDAAIELNSLRLASNGNYSDIRRILIPLILQEVDMTNGAASLKKVLTR
ncbi:hypothetical protein BZG36_05388, partial [Bifiguratus adelaidae]